MTKHSTRRLATILAAAIALVGLGTAPALAESQSHQDPRGDVKKVSADGRGKASIDLVRAANKYKGDTLSLSMTGAKLPKKGYAAAWIITTDGGYYQLVVDHQTEQVLVDFSGSQDACPGAKAKVKGDVVSGSIPRACLGGANEVRIATVMIEPQSASQFKVDDALKKGYKLTEGPKFGPTLERN